MLSLLENTINTNLFHEYCSLGIRRCKQLCKNDEIRVDFSSLFYQVSCHINLCTMQVVHPESIKILSHLLHIFQHMLPCLRRIRRLLSISNPQQISPSIHASSKIVVFLRCNEDLTRICTANPTIIDGIKVFISPFHFREIFVHKRIRIVESSIFILEIVILNASYCDSYNLRHPFYFNLPFPIIIIRFYGKSKI